MHDLTGKQNCLSRVLLPLALSIATLTTTGISVSAGSACNPVIGTSAGTLIDTLTILSKLHDFDFTVPSGMDHPVEGLQEMTLHQALENITRGMSTSFTFDESNDCAGHKLEKLVIYEMGEEPDRASTDQQVAREDEFLYIENMEQYVRDVLAKKYKARMAQMTPEQKREFRFVRKTLRSQRKLRGKTEKKVSRNNRKSAPDT